MSVKVWVIGRTGIHSVKLYQGNFFVSKQEVRNIKANVQDQIITKHSEYSISVSLTVSEPQQEAYDPF